MILGKVECYMMVIMKIEYNLFFLWYVGINFIFLILLVNKICFFIFLGFSKFIYLRI